VVEVGKVVGAEEGVRFEMNPLLVTLDCFESDMRDHRQTS
jgi:hypothetical protein